MSLRARLLVLLITGASLLVAAETATAHPLGNFTVNHLSQVRISSDAVTVHYVLDQAEIPTFRERRRSGEDVLADKRDAVVRGLKLTVDGRAVPLEAVAPGRISMPMGQGGLRTTRVELDLRASVRDPRQVRLRDETFPGRIGWKAIILKPGRGTAVRSTDAFSTDPTDGLRRYPSTLLESPLDLRAASFTVAPGDGSVTAPRGPGDAAPGRTDRGSDGFAGVFADAADGKGVLLFLLLASFGWGALHALSPGHGKGMVAAYLIGSRGTTRDALALGAVVTVSHTIGVFALGLITLLLAQYILPEDLYPWLNLVAGLLVVVIGAGILWSRVQTARGRREPLFLRAMEHSHGDGEGHRHEHSHGHEHGHGHGHGHARGHGDGSGHRHRDEGGHEHGHGHSHSHSHSHGDHGHTHAPGREVSWKGILGMGVSAGIIPCPSALVVLLGAVSQQQVALGLLLILTFSVGLAATLAVLGIAVVHAGRLTSRLNVPATVTQALPAASALVILTLGLVLTGRALPGVV